MQKEEAAIAAIEKSLTGLNEYLLDRTVLVGESITLADIVSTCNLYLGMTKVKHLHLSDKNTLVRLIYYVILKASYGGWIDHVLARRLFIWMFLFLV